MSRIVKMMSVGTPVSGSVIVLQFVSTQKTWPVRLMMRNSSFTSGRSPAKWRRTAPATSDRSSSCTKPLETTVPPIA